MRAQVSSSGLGGESTEVLKHVIMQLCGILVRRTAQHTHAKGSGGLSLFQEHVRPACAGLRRDGRDAADLAGGFSGRPSLKLPP